MDLEKLRREIDDTDRQLVELFCRRMELCQQVGEYKKEHDLPVMNAEREEAVLQKVSAQAGELGPETKVLFSTIMDLSKDLQHREMQKERPLLDILTHRVSLRSVEIDYRGTYRVAKDGQISLFTDHLVAGTAADTLGVQFTAVHPAEEFSRILTRLSRAGLEVRAMFLREEGESRIEIALPEDPVPLVDIVDDMKRELQDFSIYGIYTY